MGIVFRKVNFWFYWYFFMVYYGFVIGYYKLVVVLIECDFCCMKYGIVYCFGFVIVFFFKIYMVLGIG